MAKDAAQPFDFAQDRELVKRPVERQMDFLRAVDITHIPLVV